MQSPRKKEFRITLSRPWSLPLHWNTMLPGARRISADRFPDQFGFTLQYAEPTQTPDAGVPMTCAFSSADDFSYKKAPVVIRSGFQTQKDVREDRKYIRSRRERSDAPLTKLQSSKNSMHALQPSDTSLYAKTSNVSPADLRTMDSRSSSFHSQSTCESGDREIGDSSTSRYSNGSSQDAILNSNEQQVRMQRPSQQKSSKEKTNSGLDHQNTSRVSPCTIKPKSTLDPSRLRFPFKLKGLFGSMKTPRLDSVQHENLMRNQPRRIRFSETYDARATANPNSMRASRHSCSEEQEAPALRTPGWHSTTSNGKGTNFVCGAPVMQRIHVTESSCKDLYERVPIPYAVYSERLQLQLPAFDDMLIADAGQRTRVQGNISKIRERWQQYMKILKAPNGSKTSQAADHKPNDQLKLAAESQHHELLKINAIKTPNLDAAFKPNMRPRPSAHDVEHVIRPKSMPTIEKTSPVYPAFSSASGSLASPITPASWLLYSPRNIVPNNSYDQNVTRAGSRHSLLPSHATAPDCATAAAGGINALPAVITSSPKLQISNNKSSSILKPKSIPKRICIPGKISSSSSNTSNTSTSSSIPSSSRNKNSCSSNSSSSMSELHSSIQGAIAHCKSSHLGHHLAA